MQKMNSSAAVILLHDRPVWHEEEGGGEGGGGTLTALSPGISAAALPPSGHEIHSKTMFELELTARRPLVFLTGELLPV